MLQQLVSIHKEFFLLCLMLEQTIRGFLKTVFIWDCDNLG
nr:hypothetical protein Iba_chr12bCG1430 [Ipomoea batatas]